MAVYQYTAMLPDREDQVESGTVMGRDEEDVRQKLKRLGMSDIRLKKITGLAGFFKRFTVDIK